MKTEMILRVDPQGEMPVLNKPMITESPITNIKYEVVPRKIKAIRWHPDGAVIIDLVADKTKLTDGEAS